MDWNTNLTYMIDSKDKTHHQPLSIIPKYTVNTTLDWQATSALSLQAQATLYGKQEPASYDTRIGQPIRDSGGALDAYALVGLSAGYRIHPQLQLRLGVNNLFDKLVKQNFQTT